MIKLILILLLAVIVLAVESQAPDGPEYWPRYILEIGLALGALSGVGGIVGKDGRPVMNYCSKCGRAYPGTFHRCEK